jgi:hypothetical protein
MQNRIEIVIRELENLANLLRLILNLYYFMIIWAEYVEPYSKLDRLKPLKLFGGNLILKLV